MSGQSGQVSGLFSFSGGCGMISSCVTDSAPWRAEVPMQSEPVSPPPMTTTCLPAARIGSATSVFSPETRRFCCGRKSMAKWMPSRSRPSIGRSRGFSAPPESSTASKSSQELLGRDRHADMDAVVEGDALRLHLRDAAVDVVLLHLEVGDAVAQQPAGARRSSRRRAPRGRRARAAARRQVPAGPEPTTATRLPVCGFGGSGHDPALLPAAVGDGAFDRLDGDRRVLEVERAGCLARRRADAAGELREIVGRVQVAQRLVPVVLVDEVVPVRDLVVHRAAVVTVRNAAIHAARRLVARRLLAERDHELAVMPDAIGRRRVLAVAPVDLEKARHLAHSRLRSLPVMAVLGPAISMSRTPDRIPVNRDDAKPLGVTPPRRCELCARSIS